MHQGRPLCESKGWRAKEEGSVGGGFRALGSREAELWFEKFSGFLLREGHCPHIHTHRAKLRPRVGMAES